MSEHKNDKVVLLVDTNGMISVCYLIFQSDEFLENVMMEKMPHI